MVARFLRLNDVVIQDDGLGSPAEQGQIRNVGGDLVAYVQGVIKSLTTLDLEEHRLVPHLAHLLDLTHEVVPVFNVDGLMTSATAQGLGGGDQIRIQDVLTTDGDGLITGYRIRQYDGVPTLVETIESAVTITAGVPTLLEHTRTGAGGASLGSSGAAVAEMLRRGLGLLLYRNTDDAPLLIRWEPAVVRTGRSTQISVAGGSDTVADGETTHFWLDSAGVVQSAITGYPVVSIEDPPPLVFMGAVVAAGGAVVSIDIDLAVFSYTSTLEHDIDFLTAFKGPVSDSTFGYGIDGSLEDITFANTKSKVFAFNLSGQLESVTYNGKVKTFTYAVDGRITDITYTNV